ncbi:MAG: hypothetical protein AABW87_02085 [Nanoarchaeota archaeon]
MTFLGLEAKTADDKWVDVGKLRPGDPASSMSNNKPDGTREIYLFECLPDGSKSVIYLSIVGIDAEIGNLRVISTKRARIVKELTATDEPYIMEIRTDKSPRPRCIRFTHNLERYN